MGEQEPVLSSVQLDSVVLMKRMIRDFTAGAMGGTACVLAGQPLDTVKVKMQTFPHLFKNSYDCFMSTLKAEKIRGLYAGTIPALTANVAENSILFLFYGRCLAGVKMLCGKEKLDDLTVFERSCAGSGAAVFSTFALCPTELVKCKLQAQHQISPMEGKSGPKSGVLQVTAQILREDGFLGLFRGFTPTLVREVPGYFFFFGGYEGCKYLLTPAGKTKDDLGPFSLAFAGGVAGCCLWTSIFPADVVKSRVQILTSNSGRTPGFFEVLLKILRTEGPRALYKGLGPMCLRSFPANGALFLAYEGTQILFNRAWDLD